MKTHLVLQNQVNMVKCDWVFTRLTKTSFVMSTEVVINITGIMVGDPLEWFSLQVGPKKRIYISFDD